MKNIGIIGSNGLVGKAVIESLNIIKDKYNYYYYSRNFELEELKNLDYAILAVSNDIAKLIYDYIFLNNLIITVIDNSSEFRLYDNIILCIPEINQHLLNDIKKTNFIANPNCVTTLMCIILKPLLDLSKIERIIVSTYQAASGAGYKGLEELELQTKEYSEEKKLTQLTQNFWKKQYVYNVFSHNSPIVKSTLYNEEEMKLINETQKILNIKCKITPTCIRVPTLRSHCLSLNVEFSDELTLEMIKTKLENFPGIVVLDDIENNQFPEPVITSSKTDIYVGRIRPDIYLNKNDLKCWNFFISGDQLLKGAGYNSVQILKYILDNQKF
jgi:aspartate-semialdehyde dehydrogenase